jgi:hypothetical protein
VPSSSVAAPSDGRHVRLVGGLSYCPSDNDAKEWPRERARAVGQGLGNGDDGGAEAAAADVNAAIEHVDEHVAKVLEAAERAAEQIRREAHEEAERLRADARAWAEETIAHAEMQADDEVAEAAAYNSSIRTRCDEYSADTRRETDAVVLRIVGAADERADEILDTARREAAALVQAERDRNERIAAEERRNEQAVERLYAGFADLTARLAKLREPGLPKEIVRPSAREPAGTDTGAAEGEPTETPRDTERQVRSTGSAT